MCCLFWYSCGCTVVEILTGAPPYTALAPLSALYRIVTDDAPPLPSNISSHCQDFLMKCFQKEPRLRASARDLADHPWLATWRVLEKETSSSMSLLEPRGKSHLRGVQGSTSKNESAKTRGSVVHEQRIGTSDQLQRFREGNETFDDFVFENKCKLTVRLNYEESSALSDSLDHQLSDDSDSSDDSSDWSTDPAMNPTAGSPSPSFTPDDLVQMLANLRIPDADLSPLNIAHLRTLLIDPELRSVFVSKHGILPLLGLMDLKSCACVALLREVLQEGGTRVITQAAALGLASSTVQLTSNNDAALRLECARMIALLVRHSASTLQLFVACGGVNALVHQLNQSNFGSDDDVLHFEVTASTASSIRFSLTPQQDHGGTEAGTLSVNDLCRLFAKEGLLRAVGERFETLLASYITCSTSYDQLRSALNFQEVTFDSQNADYVESSLLVGCLEDILTILSTMARSGNALCSQFATETALLRGIVAILNLRHEGGDAEIHSKLVLHALKTVHSLSMDPCTLESLEAVRAVPALVKQLESIAGADDALESYTIQALFYLLRVSFHRQNEAASCGLVPHLIRVAQGNSQVKQFALPMLCDLAHASHACRVHLKEHDVAAFFLDLSSDSYWRTPALNSLVTWHKEDRAFLDHFLTSEEHSEKLATFFCRASRNAESTLGPFLVMLTKSPLLCAVLSLKEGFASRAISHLTSNQAIVRRGALQILALLLTHHSYPRSFAKALDLRRRVEGLCRDEDHLLVTETALALLASIDAITMKPEELTGCGLEEPFPALPLMDTSRLPLENGQR